MIINISRAKSFQSCRQYAFNWDELKLYPKREADPLIIGEGYHLGSEIITKSADVTEAVAAVEKRMRERYADQTILPEELPDIERNIEFAKHAVAQWAENYDKADYRVLWPEVTGCVPLPGSEHHCWFVHRMLEQLYPAVVPSYDACGASFSIEGRSCWQPHYFKFKTDGVIKMYKYIYLLEQKTTSRMDSNFWTKFQLNKQIRGYPYGVWKKTGVLVNGVLVNAIIKHSKQITVNGQKKFQLDPTNVGFEREPILVTKEDLLDFERELIQIANDYEEAFKNPLKIYKNEESCYSWNRRCYYWNRCLRHNDPSFDTDEFVQRKEDYVEEEYRTLLGLQPKEDVCQK